MGSSQSQVQVTNQITNIHASEGSKVSSSDTKEARSELEQLLQQISPLVIVALSLILLFSVILNLYLCYRIKKIKREKNGMFKNCGQNSNNKEIELQKLHP
uniref:NSP1-1 n=1 Tax=Rotavirus G TaxID=183407 RepID=A0A3G1RPF0_9REOV|nr:MAG: NSP1-1 [Rotavirus G]